MESGGSLLIKCGIAGLALIVGGGCVAAIRYATTEPTRTRVTVQAGIVAALWFGIPALLATSGALLVFDRKPPPFMLMMLALLIATAVLAFSSIGTRLARQVPLALLVGAQGFRLPLELVMHQAASEGVMPVQMSYSGHNFDIVTGGTALLMALLIATDRAPRGLVLAWNLMGLGLLINIVTIAIISTPLFAAYGPEQLNTWVADFPYVWLPGVLVPAALLGHLLIFRRLNATPVA